MTQIMCIHSSRRPKAVYLAVQALCFVCFCCVEHFSVEFVARQTTRCLLRGYIVNILQTYLNSLFDQLLYLTSQLVFCYSTCNMQVTKMSEVTNYPNFDELFELKIIGGVTPSVTLHGSNIPD